VLLVSDPNSDRRQNRAETPCDLRLPAQPHSHALRRM